MRVPNFDRFRKTLPYLGVFICGIVIGSALFMSIYHIHFNHLYLKYHSLLLSHNKLIDDTESLRKNKNKQNVIHRVQVHVNKRLNDTPLDQVIENEINHKVSGKLKTLIGQPVSNLANLQSIVEELVNGVYTNIEERDYTIEVRSIMIHADFQIWITAKEYIKN